MAPDSPNTQKQSQKDDPRVLAAQIDYVTTVQRAARSRKERLEDLMSRKKSKKWDKAKKAKMVRRLVASNDMLEQCASALTELQPRLEALQKPAKTNNVAPFVPPPATSEG